MLILMSFGHAQSVKVIDGQTLRPVEGVLIYNADNTNNVQTNRDGEADITRFNSKDILIFQHPSYIELNIQFAALAKNNYTITLQEKVIQYDEVVISANKWEQNTSEVPNEILNISAKDISHSNAQTSADLLKSTGQVYVQKSQLGGGSPTLRGFAANRVLLVVDGVRMNNAIFRSGNLQNIINIDPNALESAEVVFGPGSVIYGSDALGGVMDFHTLKPQFSNHEQLKLSGTVFTRYSSANNEKTGHMDWNVGGNKLAWMSSFSYSSYDDLKTGSNFDADYLDFGKRPLYADRVNGQDVIVTNDDLSLQKFSGFDQWSAINKLRYRPTDNLEFSYGFYFANTTDIPRYDRLVRPSGNGLRQAEWYYGPQKWVMHHISATSFVANSLYDEAKIIATYQQFDESRHDRRFGSDRLRNQMEHVDLFTVNLDMDKSKGKNSLYYGLEYTYNDVNSKSDTIDIVTEVSNLTQSRYPDGGSQYSSIAAYATYKWRISDHWVMNSGVRLSNVSLSGNSSNADAQLLNFDSFDISNSAVSGSLGLVYNPKKGTKLDLILSSGFRSPNIDDVGKVFELDEEDDGTPIVIVPNSNLQPEYSFNVEFGITNQWRDKIKVNFVVYYTLLNNAIVRGPFEVNGSTTAMVGGQTSSLRAQVNTNQAYIYGGTASATFVLPHHFALSSSFTVTQGEDKTKNEPLRHTTPNFGKTALSFANKGLNIELWAEYNGNRFRKDIPTTEIDDKDYLYAIHNSDASKDGSPAWKTFNLKASYQVSKWLQVSGAMENITDVHYRPYSSGISAPGRNFIVSFRAKLH